jgi:hypothetical protein
VNVPHLQYSSEPLILSDCSSGLGLINAFTSEFFTMAEKNRGQKCSKRPYIEELATKNTYILHTNYLLDSNTV